MATVLRGADDIDGEADCRARVCDNMGTPIAELQHMGTDGLIVAAGLSSRMGEFKPVLRFGEKTVIDVVIDAMSSVCASIVVVGGHRIDLLRDAVAKHPQVKLVFNEKYRNGMFSSVKSGVRHVSSESFFYMPCDLPLVAQGTYQKMLDYYHRSDCHGGILIPTCQGRKGHPVLFDSAHAPRIALEPDESNLRAYITRARFQTLDVDSDTILFDIDSPEEYRTARKRYSANSVEC